MSSVALETRKTDSPLTVERLNPTIGAEVGGVDLTRPLSADLRETLKSLLLKLDFIRDLVAGRPAMAVD